MNSTDRFRHDRSAYERPTLGWRCGRAAGWGTPCKRGPTASGVCRGQDACKPARAGEAWQCRRPAADGGPCTTGPDKDGVCGLHRPPCAPRRTFRIWRGRLTALAIGATVALLALLALETDLVAGRPSSLDPGPLSAAHSHFVGAGACATCHTAFGKGATAWWQAFWSSTAVMPAAQPASTGAGDAAASGATLTPQAAHRLSAACTECHSFGGKEQKAHNRVFEDHAELAPTDCMMCHTEHKGSRSRITTLTQAQCQSCHTRTIKDFASGHPAFSASFPYEHPQSIRFDHANHFGKHFKDPSAVDKVPAGGCVGCHVVAEAGRAIRPAAFETVCAGCHGESIGNRDFVFFRWPEMEANNIPADDVTKVCGPNSGPEEGAFSAIGVDRPTALSGFLLDAATSNTADYEKPMEELSRSMMSEGAEPLIAKARDHLSSAPIDRMFAGLDAELRPAACAWAANKEYTRPGETKLPGWRADGLELRYKNPSHADPVIRGWIDFLAAIPSPPDIEAQGRLQRARSELLATEGPGQCAKCHTVSGREDGTLAVSWKVHLRSAAPLTRFDHRPHLDLLGPEKTCTSCHQLSEASDTVTSAGLKPIALATCSQCHAAGQVRDDCRTCHFYHQEHAFKKRMVQDAK
jgi:hypothetical protein